MSKSHDITENSPINPDIFLRHRSNEVSGRKYELLFPKRGHWSQRGPGALPAGNLDKRVVGFLNRLKSDFLLRDADRSFCDFNLASADSQRIRRDYCQLSA